MPLAKTIADSADAHKQEEHNCCNVRQDPKCKSLAGGGVGDSSILELAGLGMGRSTSDIVEVEPGGLAGRVLPVFLPQKVLVQLDLDLVPPVEIVVQAGRVPLPVNVEVKGHLL